MKEFKRNIIQLFTLLFILGYVLSPLAIINPSVVRNQILSTNNDIKDLVWFYENLTPDDRRNIRQAMDYAIPRDLIITNIIQGYGEKIATPIGKQFSGVYDPSIQARDNDTNTALDLLEPVFGYRYDGSTDPYFNMTLICPSTNADRMQWAALTNKTFHSIGINSTLQYVDWGTMLTRTLANSDGTDYSHGGFDALFIGWVADPDPDFTGNYHRDYIPSSNYIQLKNDEIEEIVNRSLESVDISDRIQAFKDFQVWFNTEVPASIIHQGYKHYAMDINLAGFDYFLGSNFQNWTIDTQNSMTCAISAAPENFNPILGSRVEDTYIANNVFGSLLKRRGNYNLTHPVGFLADSWSSNPDGLVWTVNLQQGVQWHDGTEVTAEDVVFSYRAAMNDDVNSEYNEFFQDIFSSPSAITNKSRYVVEFTLQNFYSYMETRVLTLPIIQKAQMESISFSDWKLDGTNTGSTVLQGFGPYEFVSFDGSSVLLTKSDNYNENRMGHNPSAVGGPIWWPNATIQTVNITVDPDPSSCKTNLENGVYDFIDRFVVDKSYLPEIEASTWGKVVSYLEWGWQELGYNQNSPIWGINPVDPHVMYPGEYPDTTPPTIYIDSPTAIIYDTGTLDISLSSDVYPSWSLIGDAKHFWYYIEGIDSENQSWSPSVQQTLDDGTYTLHAYGNDSLGNEAHTTVTFTINAVLPSVIIDSPVAATYSTSEITIEMSGTANYFWYYIEGADTSNQTWTSSVERSLPDGMYTLNA
ncbi:MAG: ABC transporter substrate-binding protein, partial [Candidatus Hodarchaeales archaeon]